MTFQIISFIPDQHINQSNSQMRHKVNLFLFTSKPLFCSFHSYKKGNEQLTEGKNERWKRNKTKLETDKNKRDEKECLFDRQFNNFSRIIFLICFKKVLLPFSACLRKISISIKIYFQYTFLWFLSLIFTIVYKCSD